MTANRVISDHQELDNTGAVTHGQLDKLVNLTPLLVAAGTSQPLTPASRTVSAGAGIAITDGGPGGQLTITNVGGGGSPAIVWMETPSGVTDGVNTSFSLANTPIPSGSLMLFVNGVLQEQAPVSDYTISGGKNITLTIAPRVASNLLAVYPYGSGSSGALTQAVWYFDPVSGSNANTGLTSGSALQTWSEYRNRVGAKPTYNFEVDFYLMNDIPDTDPVFVSAYVGPSGSLRVHGIPTILRSSTLTGVTNYDQTSGQAQELVDGTYDWTSDVGTHLIAINSGDVRGPIRSWPIKALSAGHVRVDWLSVRDSSSYADIGSVGIGNAYTILQLPKIGAFGQDITDTNNETSALNPPFLAFMVELVQFADSVEVKNPEITFDCIHSNPFPEDFCTMVHPLLIGFQSFSTGMVTSVLACLFDSSITCNGSWISYGIILQNSKIMFSELQNNVPSSFFHVHHAATGAGCFDCDSPFQVYEGGQVVIEGIVWGQNNTTSIFDIRSAGYVVLSPFYTGKLLAHGTGIFHDFTIDLYTSLPAVDPTTFVPTASRVLSFTNFVTSVAGGGFEGNVFSPRSPRTGVFSTP